MKPKMFLISLVLIFSFNAFSKTSLPATTSSALKDQLFAEASRNHNPVGYGAARVNLLGHMAVHQVQNKLYVKDVYCESDYASPGIGRIPNNSVINVEHTWPQSKFKGSSYGRFQKSDLHHLYPADSQLNSIRGSNPFGEVVKETQNTKCPMSLIGNDSAGHRVFEPPQAHKGNVARALFYFAVRYKMSIPDFEEVVLKKWNIEDPVDDAELLRNDQVQDYQGNRNPFIDQPDLANQIADF
jgi:deoxyribonuclease I